MKVNMNDKQVITCELKMMVAYLDSLGEVDDEIYQTIIRVTVANVINILEGKTDGSLD